MAKAWQPLLAEEKQKEYFVQLMQRVEQARETEVIFPPESEVFNALKLTAPEQVKVVILGQDPYHGPGQAHGLSLSVPEGVKLPPHYGIFSRQLCKITPKRKHRLMVI